MVVTAMKHMASNFAKLDKFEGVDFRRWQKKMHFLLSSMSVVYVLTTPISDDGGDDPTVEQVRKRAKWDNDDYAKYMAEDASSKKFLVSNFTNYKMTYSRLVLEQYNELLGILGRFTQHKMNMDEAIQVSCIIDKLPFSWKDFKHTLEHKKEDLTLVKLGSQMRIKESLRVQDSDKPKSNNVAGPSVVNMVEHNNSSRYNDNKGKRKHHDNTRADPNKKAKPTCWKYGKTGHIKRDCKGVNVDNKASNSGTKGSLDDRCWFKTYESVNDGSIHHMGNKLNALVRERGCVDLKFSSGKIISLFNVLHHVILGHVHFKRMQDMSKDGFIPAFDMDTEKCKTCMLTKITKIPFQNVKRKTKVLELIHNDLCDLHATPSLGNKKYFVTFIDDASRTESRVLGAVVRLPDPNLQTLDKKGIECIFVGYVEHFKAFRFYVFEANESVSINSIIESRDAIFDENRFSSLPIPSLTISNRTEDTGGSVVPEEVTEESQDVALWKEAINDEIDSIMGNNTWVLVDLPPGCKPLGCKWIFKRKLKVDGTIEKFKERLIIQGFRQKSSIGYFDNYAPVACISTIRLLIAMASIHNLIIHQMDVKTAFLNGKLDEEVYMNQPLGFIMPGNENKVDLTREFFSTRFSMEDMGEADVILGIRIKHGSNGIAISQSYYIEKALKKFSYFDCTPMSSPMDTSEKLMPNNDQPVSQLEYSRVIGCLMYAMTCTKPDIAFVVGKLATPLSPAYVPDPMELEHHIPVYVPEPDYPEYLAPSDDDIPIDYAADADDDEDGDEESSEDDDDEEEEHLAPADSTAIASPNIDLVPSAEETEPFETYESAATPPPPPPAYRTTSRMSVRTQTPIPFPFKAEIPSPPLPLPSPPTHNSPTYAKAPISYRASGIWLRVASSLPLPAPSTSCRADIPEADIPPQKMLCLTAPTPSFERDHAALHDEGDTLRRYLSSLCTTHEQDRVEAHQGLDRSEAHNRAFEAQITVLKTHTYRHEWQCQDANDHAIRAIMRIQTLEAGARIDTLEDTSSSA
ncbi:zinc finger, CCHC-type containing protein [Tanacetum coccineum]|uniref:Zinc finger, CCHC-type containing protein n=1 Tax=Tanacetum coccineum TaxID=301880 RepID=A0ABQ5IV41_9ASTR